ncbi:uncharacterized protein [Solanum lycopersicum]|uniref:uncharacterized protein n=1 Tax=Solanum lycopersicum TaxID=4081 RepID=UPI000276679E|nr:uncharacterized protein LOC101267317 [Solanum lycopersicum]XP_025887482.1 uncharacterized protein LOC101267317 [Solanum lycopersicum]XP_025887483.1 uncharacterized protein LOC101267317 [Solanum lycopersicum]
MTMTMTTAMASPSRRLLIDSCYCIVSTIPKNVAIYPATAVTKKGLLKHCISLQGRLRSLVKPVSAASSGLEADSADECLKNAKIVVESEEAEKIQVRVDVNGEYTKMVFDSVLTKLAKSEQPIPGFRREKGGKTSQVPREFLPQILGEERVTNSVIREIINSTLAEYVKKENLAVKDNKISITQTADELMSSFAPGMEFGFNAILWLEKSKTEATT